tara:strand:+ start:85549 stop:86352 length:804 start_codon:yes stop_codon:yes gene_type:complete
MIKFFRHIRKNLLMKSKTGVYLKYAIGEIALVMIGILLALQVNNWNQSRLNHNLEETYFLRLIEDLQEDKAIMQATLNYSNQVMEHAKKAVLFLEEDFETNKDYVNILINLYQASQIQYPAAVKSTYQELLSSGHINIIQDINLRTSLIRYYEYNWTNSSILDLPSLYRGNLRSKMPDLIQNKIREECDDVYIKIRDTYEVSLPKKCSIDLPLEKAYQTAIALQKDQSLKKDLRVLIGNLEAKINYLNSLKRQLNELIVKIKPIHND